MLLAGETLRAFYGNGTDVRKARALVSSLKSAVFLEAIARRILADPPLLPESPSVNRRPMAGKYSPRDRHL